jgi:hypothetical protein
MCDTNKNVTEMDVIIKGVYYIMTITIFLLDIMFLAPHNSWKIIKFSIFSYLKIMFPFTKLKITIIVHFKK